MNLFEEAVWGVSGDVFILRPISLPGEKRIATLGRQPQPIESKAGRRRSSLDRRRAWAYCCGR